MISYVSTLVGDSGDDDDEGSPKERHVMPYSNVMIPVYFIPLNPLYSNRKPPPNAARLTFESTVATSLSSFSAATLTNSESGMEQCLLLSVVEGRITVEPERVKPNEWWRQRRSSDFLRGLNRVKSRLDDMQLVFCPYDCPPGSRTSEFGYPDTLAGDLSNADHTFFTLVQCPTHSKGVSVPLVSPRGKDDPTFEEWDKFCDVMLRRNDRWANRTGSVSKAVWRGHVKGKSCWSGVIGEGVVAGRKDESCGRRKLMKIASFNEDVFDVEMDDYIELQRQAVYAVNLAVEGHCGWSDRAALLAHMGGALVKQER